MTEDLDRLDALLDEIQGISPRSAISTEDNQSANEEPVGESQDVEEDVSGGAPEQEPEDGSNISNTSTVKKRSGSKGAKAKPSSSTASGSKSSKTNTTRSTSGTKKSSSSTSKRSSSKKQTVTKTKSSSSIAKPVAHNLGDTHIIEVNGQKYDMSTVKIKRSVAPSTTKQTNSNLKPKVS